MSRPVRSLDHRLEIEQRLEPALGDLGLVGRVRGVPAGVLEDVPLDDRRRDAVVVAHPDERAENLVLRGDAPERLEELVLGLGRREIERAVVADAARHGVVDERVERRRAEDGEHARHLLFRGTDVAPGKLAGIVL